jgi:hypothetical protein
MERKSQTHIFSGGEKIVETFKSAVKEYHIDRVVVFSEILESEGGQHNIDKAIESLGQMARVNGIDFDRIKVIGNNMEEVMDAIVRLKNLYPEDSFYFNLTGGRKVLALYLYTMAIWIDGIPYYVDISGNILEFKIPKIRRETLRANLNLVKILQIVSNKGEKSNSKAKFSEVYEEIASIYQPLERTLRKGNYKLPMGTFSKWVRVLIENNLIEEGYIEGSHKNKYLEITTDGIFALKFFNE